MALELDILGIASWGKEAETPGMISAGVRQGTFMERLCCGWLKLPFRSVGATDSLNPASRKLEFVEAAWFGGLAWDDETPAADERANKAGVIGAGFGCLPAADALSPSEDA